MSTHTTNDNKAGRDRIATRTARRETTETKPAFKTTELIVYIVAVIGVLIASAMVDENEDGQGFGAESAWKYVTWLTIGYMLARGLAKAGSYERDNDPRT
jgi:hypothetical protein